MELLPGYIRRFIPHLRTSTLGRREILLWGVAVLGTLLLVLIFWDMYLFYNTLTGVGRSGEVIKPAAGVSVREIDEVIQLLDERRKKFYSVLLEQ